MKASLFTLTLLMLYCGVFAQYKKASFFGKEGRTYGLYAQVHNLGDGKGSVTGVNLSFGRDQDEKRLFTFWEFQFIPSYKFSYLTADYDDKPITVSGKSKFQFIYALNWAYHILPNESDRIVRPYLTAGLNWVVLGGYKSMDNDDYYSAKKLPSERNLNLGIGGGAGALIRLGANWAVKVEGGYMYQWNLDNSDGEYTQYFMYTSHTYANAGIRYRLAVD